MMLTREQMLQEMVLDHQKSLETQDVDLDAFVTSARTVVHEQHWILGLTRLMQFEKSLYIAMYAESPDMIQFDKLQLLLNYLDNASIGTTIFMDQIVTWCLHLLEMKLGAAGTDMMRQLARRVYPHWRALFGANDDQVIRLSKAASICAECGQGGSSTAGSGTVQLKRCARCKSIEYCSVECQRKNWAHHKAQCSQST